MAQSADPDLVLLDRDSGASLSRHSSIQGPYRVPDTFPQCNPVSSVDGLLETYTRSLLSTGNGYPIWELGGNLNRPKEHIKQGVSVGDVGILDPDGDLAVAFNIFRPPGDPIQDRLPEGFVEVTPTLDRSQEIEFDPNYFNPGTIISSPGVHVEVVSKDPLDVRLFTTAREGGTLILPEGASREDLTATARSRLTEYIKEHAFEWYRLFCNNAPSVAGYIPNDSLYLVTGCDKARAYGLCSIPRETKDAGKPTEMRYRYSGSPPWEDNRPAATKSRTLAQAGDRTFSVFIRGIRISLSNRLWTKGLPLVEGGAFYNILTTPVLGFRSRVVRLKEQFIGPSETDLSDKEKVHFHPSIILSQLLLKKAPAADIAIIDDSIWCNMITGRHLTLRNVINLIASVMESCDVVIHGKVAVLVPRADGLPMPIVKSRKPLPSLFGLFEKKPHGEVLRDIRKIVRPPWYSLVV